MILTKDVPPGTPSQRSGDHPRQRRLPDLRQGRGRGSKANNPKVTALRIKRPAQPPEFAADARGFLVAISTTSRSTSPPPIPRARPVRDWRARPRSCGSRFLSSRRPSPIRSRLRLRGSHRVKAKLEDFTPSPTSQVLAFNDDESKPTASEPVQRSAGAQRPWRLGCESQPIDASLDNLKLRGFAIQSISPLDPSGWVRLSLTRRPGAPPAGVAAAPAVTPPASLPRPPGRRPCPPPASRHGDAGRGHPSEPRSVDARPGPAGRSRPGPGASMSGCKPRHQAYIGGPQGKSAHDPGTHSGHHPAQLHKLASFFWAPDPIAEMQAEYDRAVAQLREGRVGLEQYRAFVERVGRQVARNAANVNRLEATVQGLPGPRRSRDRRSIRAQLQTARKELAENQAQLRLHEQAYENNLLKIKHAGGKLARDPQQDRQVRRRPQDEPRRRPRWPSSPRSSTSR